MNLNFASVRYHTFHSLEKSVLEDIMSDMKRNATLPSNKATDLGVLHFRNPRVHSFAKGYYLHRLIALCTSNFNLYSDKCIK